MNEFVVKNDSSMISREKCSFCLVSLCRFQRKSFCISEISYRGRLFHILHIIRLLNRLEERSKNIIHIVFLHTQLLQLRGWFVKFFNERMNQSRMSRRMKETFDNPTFGGRAYKMTPCNWTTRKTLNYPHLDFPRGSATA